MNWAMDESASTVRNKSATAGAACGHATASASLPPQGSAEQNRAQGRNGQPALHGHIIALTGQEEKGPIRLPAARCDARKVESKPRINHFRARHRPCKVYHPCLVLRARIAVELSLAAYSGAIRLFCSTPRNEWLAFRTRYQL